MSLLAGTATNVPAGRVVDRSIASPVTYPPTVGTPENALLPGPRRARIANVPFNELGRIDERDRQSYRSCFERVLQRGRFLGGPEVEAFEHEFAETCGVGETSSPSATGPMRSS